MKNTFRLLPCLSRLTVFPFVFFILLPFSDVTLRGDDRATLELLFKDSTVDGSSITIPPGDYYLDGKFPIELKSNRTVYAYGARLHFPADLEDKARRVLFTGQNISNLNWFGGHFQGNVYDPDRSQNSWLPNANTRAIVITTAAENGTKNLTFRDISSNGLAGAAITVLGAERPKSDREIIHYAKNILIDHCTFERTGKFMWDYGYLWQRAVWPEEYSDSEKRLVEKFFRNDLIRHITTMKKDDDRIFFDNKPLLPVSVRRDSTEVHRGYDSICFFGDKIPTNIVRGKQYFVIESKPDFIRIADTPEGDVIRFASTAGSEAKLITNLFQAHLALYAPTGSGPGKGAIDLVGCRGIIVRNSTLSALGDTMHIQKSQDIVFEGNRITGSRMGAFFLAEYCKNAVVKSNLVDGTNGSRVVSVEKSCEDVIITANTFRNGGRGSWINQPRNFLLTDNIFVNNTTKCEPDPLRGRRSFVTGDYEKYAELYFTTYEPNGHYENVVVRNNIFFTGNHASHAISFAPGVSDFVVEGNLIMGEVRSIELPSHPTGTLE